jgi:hypothetical protein
MKGRRCNLYIYRDVDVTCIYIGVLCHAETSGSAINIVVSFHMEKIPHFLFYNIQDKNSYDAIFQKLFFSLSHEQAHYF